MHGCTAWKSTLAIDSITVLQRAELRDVLHTAQLMARLHLCWRLLSVKGSCSEPRLRLALDCLLSAEDLTSCCCSRMLLRPSLLPSCCPACTDDVDS